MALPATAEDFEHAIDAYVTGESIEAAAARFHTGPQRLRDALATRGLLRDPVARIRLGTQKMVATRRAKAGLPDAEIVQRYLAGESEKALAEVFGVSRSAIRARLRAADVAPRGRSESMALRMAATSAAERHRLTAAAHEAARGRVKTWEEQCRRARTRQERQHGISPAEQLLQGWLAERGVASTPQLAIGPYNADLGAAPVAVEIFGGKWHGYGRHRRRAPERYRHILDQGWTVAIVWVERDRYPLGVAAADYIAALVERTRGDPAMRGQYWVIRGDGQELAAAQDDLDQIADVPTRR